MEKLKLKQQAPEELQENVKKASNCKGNDMSENKNLWELVGNRCLKQAYTLLNAETVLTIEAVQTVSGLVNIAIAIDKLNLHWSAQNQYVEQVFRGQFSSQTEAGNLTGKHVAPRQHLDL